MLFSAKAFVACLLPQALAQYGPPSNSATSSTAAGGAAASPSTTSSSTPGVQTVAVGKNNGLTFTPNTITAPVGSSIEFIFSPPMHSVTQSTFSSPCINAGFFSGFFNTTSGTNANAFTITVNDTNPIWFFCSFPDHCELGMAGVINPPSDGSSTLAQYMAAAAKVQSPPEPSVVQGGSIGPVKAATASSSTGSSGSSGSSTSSAAATSSTTKSDGARGFETGGGAQWVVFVLTGLAAVGFGTLIM